MNASRKYMSLTLLRDGIVLKVIKQHVFLCEDITCKGQEFLPTPLCNPPFGRDTILQIGSYTARFLQSRTRTHPFPIYQVPIPVQCHYRASLWFQVESLQSSWFGA